MPARCLIKARVAEELNISDALYALIRRNEIGHIKVGGRGVHLALTSPGATLLGET